LLVLGVSCPDECRIGLLLDLSDWHALQKETDVMLQYDPN